jgi:perosamine synthetase
MLDKLAINGGKPASSKQIKIAKPIIRPDTLKEIEDIINSGCLRQGPKVNQFENLFKERVDAKYAYATNNGTSALHVAYLSTLKPGDEVIVPSFTFLATVSMVHYSMAKPVFTDICPYSYTINPEDVKEKITPKTRAIVPVHIFGNAADIHALRDLCSDHNLILIYDSAHAHGTRYSGKDVGSFDDINCYSFYPSITLTTGEGGVVTTNDPEINQIGRLLRAHGDSGIYNHVMLGFNYRLTEIQAALGIDQLKQFESFLQRRKECGEYLKTRINGIEGLNPQKITDKTEPNYSYFSLTLDPEQYKCSRDEFIKALHSENIDCEALYPVPLTDQPIIELMYDPEQFPVSEEISKRIICLPIHPALTDENLEQIAEAVEKVASYYLK